MPYARRAQLYAAVAAPPGQQWQHLWRMIDGAGGTAPDTGIVGGAPLTIAGSAAVIASGIDFTTATDKLSAVAANLVVDLKDVLQPYSVFLSMTLRSFGIANDLSKFIECTSSSSRPLQIYVRRSPADNVTARTSCTGTTVRNVNIAPYPKRQDICLVRHDTNLAILYVMDGSAVLEGSWNDARAMATNCLNGVNLDFGNSTELGNEAIDGVIHWAGLTTDILTEQEAIDISQGGRPA